MWCISVGSAERGIGGAPAGGTGHKTCDDPSPTLRVTGCSTPNQSARHAARHGTLGLVARPAATGTHAVGGIPPPPHTHTHGEGARARRGGGEGWGGRGRLQKGGHRAGRQRTTGRGARDRRGGISGVRAHMQQFPRLIVPRTTLCKPRAGGGCIAAAYSSARGHMRPAMLNVCAKCKCATQRCASYASGRTLGCARGHGHGTCRTRGGGVPTQDSHCAARQWQRRLPVASRGTAQPRIRNTARCPRAKH